MSYPDLHSNMGARHHDGHRCGDLCAQAQNVTVWHSGSPRVFNPEAAAWWNDLIGLTNSYRLVNNEDVIVSLPPVVIPGALGWVTSWKLHRPESRHRLHWVKSPSSQPSNALLEFSQPRDPNDQ
jgi:hypothetical protein